MPKLEYVIKIRLTEKQIKEYRLFLGKERTDVESKRGNFLADVYVFSRISTHPYQIIVDREEKV